MTEQMKYNLTDDRVFGKMYHGNLVDFIDEEKLEEAKNKVEEHHGSTIIYGVGAGLVSHGDLYIYFDMARWEIQLRYRKSMPNYNCDNYDEDILKNISVAILLNGVLPINIRLSDLIVLIMWSIQINQTIQK